MSLTCTFRSLLSKAILVIVLFLGCKQSSAAVYTVSTKADLQTRMSAAMPGDTVYVTNGTYDWGQINFSNNNGNPSSSWIVLKAQTFRGVTFTGSTYLQFKGTRVMIDGFRFANGNAGGNAVISFRSSSSNLANHCRITNIIVDNYNSAAETSNEWVGLYGTNNRVDHCTFINKSNVRATVVVWYSSTTYPNPATSTYHRIDSNYFNGRSYMGSNGGETIRVGDSNSSRTDGYNTIEYNLFENCTQTEPEIISNKSDYNTYRYNTFKNSKGGLTLRHGRYCSVYGNYFIVDNVSVAEAYGIRVIDKGHKIFNNYFEALNGNSGSLTSARAPISLYNGLSSVNDTTDAAKAAGYFPADSCIVAFNTIVNAKGGAGIILGYTDGGSNTHQPLGIVIANNIIKMSQGQAVQLASYNTLLTYSAEGNMYNAPSGLGVSSSTGFATTSLLFGSRYHGILVSPANVQDAAVNTPAYLTLLQGQDNQQKSRSAIYDVGATELNGSGDIISNVLDSNVVGAGKPASVPLPVKLVSFNAVAANGKVQLVWRVAQQFNLKFYEVEWSTDGVNYTSIGKQHATSSLAYTFTHLTPFNGKNYYRLKLVDIDNSFTYSPQKLTIISTDKVDVYPNPANKFIAMQLSKIPAKAILFNSGGKAVRQVAVNSNNATIDIQALPAGVYQLQIIQQQTISSYPIIIAK